MEFPDFPSPSGPEEDTLLGERSRESSWCSGCLNGAGQQACFTARRIKDTKNGVTREGKKITGVFVVRCSWHGLEFQVTGAGSRGSEARVQVVRSYKGFKGQSQGARWCWASAACGLARDSSTPALPPAGCMNSGQLQRRCGCWREGRCRWPPARRSGRRRHWQCASGWWELLPWALIGWKWAWAAWRTALHSHWRPDPLLEGPPPCPCWCAHRADTSSWPWPPGLVWWRCCW